ncbi:prepilin-type N-terminal cleavage/methylation domain-containing protein [Oscillibacter valericigenes]|uniref:GLUG motif-containing protein n=1 Tax=Oscillibacter valericigenes TaxID=351091 RepID=UPI001F2478BB|nr:GLUG motif-containing protein [Oscillibacter valericigenes]MCF2615670.1 prepilin-type N-terminal cleavage/methylation domain-containing protein [Oscillibacter valericigenes]
MKRSKSGFSMTELLTVVAILAVLIAVAVPAVIAASKTLKMRELDDTAREIFLAAQNTLTARKADGTLSAPEGDQVEGQEGWYWLFDGDTDFLLPDGAVEPAVAENHIAIWYNAGSAMVVEVYYGEKNGSFASPGCDEWNVGYIQNGAYSNSRRQSGSAGEARAEKRIGYYDGTDLPRGAVEQLLPPVLEIVNSDELKVIVTVPKQHKKNDLAAPLIPSELTVLVEGTGEGGQKVLLSFDQTGCTDISSGDSRKYELVLDSLTEESLQFKKVCPTITPGANIRVTAKLSAEDEKDEEGKVITRYLSASAREDTNSLFADRDENNIVSVACARHLQNLEDSFSGFACASAVNVKQTSRIDWPADKCDFFSIENDCIKAYDGGKLEIRGLDAGLFNSTSENMQMEHIRIVNPIIEGSGNVGALVNTAQNARIDDCWIYATTIKPEKTEPQTEDFNALKTDFIVKGGTVGGLVGSATGCTITNSFAALSKVEGNTVGGLIGSASGCTITNCYATAENLSGSTSAMFIGSMTGGNVTGCYAAGNIASSGGTVSGFANGSGEFSNSYCAVSYNNEDGTPTGTKPQYGFAAGPVVACAYLDVNTPSVATEKAVPKSYEELKTRGSSWKALSAAETHPYRAELNGQAYPFPGLSMPHYGSWPVQTVKGIKLYNSPDGKNEIQVVLVPNGGTATIWAAVDGDSADITVKVPKKFSGQIFDNKTGVQCSPKDANGLTQIDITVRDIKGNNDKNRVAYFDVIAGGYTLRAVVVVYSGSIELSPVGGLNEGRKTGSDDYLGNEVLGYLALSSENSSKRTATLTTVLKNLLPNNPKSEFDDLYNIKPTANWSTDGSIFDNWMKIKDGYPVITPEEDPITGVRVLTTKKLADGGLEVTGAASGTVQAVAEWAMNTQLPEERQLTAKMDVQMKGARALIKEASATPCLDVEGGTASKSGYPYQLDLTAEPGKDIKLTFTPHLFNGPKTDTTNDQYDWNVYRVDEDGSKGDEVSRGVTLPNTDAESGEYPLNLTEHPANARYLVMLTYHNNDTQEQSVDYMYFSVYRSAKRAEEASGNIQIIDGAEKLLDAVNLGGGISADAKVEQKHSESYPTADVVTLQSYVQGAANTQTQWSFSTDGSNWTPITGHVGPQTVWESVMVDGRETQRMRATVEWNYGNQQLADGTATGGSVTVTGLDANEYDKPFTFQMKAEAVESSGTEESAYKTITVAVMNKLRIEPQSKVQRYYGFLGDSPKSGDFQANRTAESGSYAYEWYVGGGKMEGATESKCTVPGIPGTREVELRWGPYTSTAVLTNKSAGDGFTSNINWDEELEGKQYFLVEKGVSRIMEFSWGTGFLDTRKISKHPSTNTEVTVEAIGGNSEYEKEGIYTYKVSGLAFNRDQATELIWELAKQYISNKKTVTHYAYVIGMDIKKGDEVLSDTGETLNLEMGVPTTLTADWFFPQELMDLEVQPDGKPDIQWEISNTELVDFTDGNHTGESVSLTAKKYSATGYTTTVKATCTVRCTNGRDYTFVKYVPVEVEPTNMLTLSVTPCVSADVEDLQKCFGEVTDETVLAAKDGTDGPLTLVHEEDFNCNRMYLKVKANEDLTPYLWNISCDQFFVDVKCIQSQTDKSVIYIRLETKAANVKPVDLTLTVHIGKADVVEIPILLCDTPVIRLKDKDGADVTNGSLPVYQNQTDAVLVRLNAEMSPDLRNAETGATLDSIEWIMEALSAGYIPADYLEKEIAADGTITVKVKDLKRLPDFRVMIQAQSGKSRRSVAGYALVFLPEEDTGSGSMTRRKRYNVLGA